MEIRTTTPEIATLTRLAADALERGMPDLSILYSDAVIRLNFELIAYNERSITEFWSPNG